MRMARLMPSEIFPDCFRITADSGSSRACAWKAGLWSVSFTRQSKKCQTELVAYLATPISTSMVKTELVTIIGFIFVLMRQELIQAFKDSHPAVTTRQYR